MRVRKVERVVFACVNDRVTSLTLDPLREACEARGIEYRQFDALEFDYDPAHQLARGDMMYRAGASATALRVEQFLYAPGVATFYAGNDDRPFFVHTNQSLHFERAGLPVPLTVYCAGRDRSRLNAWVKRLGGFPILAKMGGQAGIGVVLVESAAALYSFVDFALEIGRQPALSAYIRDAVLWRVVIVGSKPVVAYTCSPEPGDFRAIAPLEADAETYTTEPPAAIAELAAAAVRVTGLEFGGVDILKRADGCYVLESNFPCFFALAQIRVGIDVAGPMLDYLVRKAGRIARTV